MTESPFCECDIRFDTCVDRYGERVCENCRKSHRPIVGGYIPSITPLIHIHNDTVIPRAQADALAQQAKERMNMPEEVTYVNHNRVIGFEIDRLQKLLATPNLDEETIKQANENLRRLLVEQRMPHAIKTNEVILDDK